MCRKASGFESRLPHQFVAATSGDSNFLNGQSTETLMCQVRLEVGGGRAAADAVLLGRVHGRAGQAEGRRSKPSPHPSRCSSGRSSRSGRPSRSARALGRKTTGEDTEIRCPPPASPPMRPSCVSGIKGLQSEKRIGARLDWFPSDPTRRLFSLTRLIPLWPAVSLTCPRPLFQRGRRCSGPRRCSR